MTLNSKETGVTKTEIIDKIVHLKLLCSNINSNGLQITFNQ